MKAIGVLVGVMATLAVLPAAASGAGGGPPAGPAAEATPAFERQLLAKAVPDECFAGVGAPYPAGPPCASGLAKVNQQYIWGMIRTGSLLWLGTGANVHCLVTGASLAAPTPTRNDDWVCEYGQSQLAQRAPDLPDGLGDYRPPHVYVYDLAYRTLTEKTAAITAASDADAKRLRGTLGMRAAGSHNGVVLMGGPTVHGTVSLFAFDSATGQYLGSTTLASYSNIRRFVVVGGVLYTGVGVVGGGGRVLRWTGDRTQPFGFAEVGTLPGEAAELVAHQGRVYVNTWPNADGSGAAAGLYVSPALVVGEPGLTPEDAAGWRQVWSVASYEPDPLIERTVGGGALASYGGFLYWGTMHVPMKATVAHLRTHPPVDDAHGRATIASTQRGISLFRGRGLAGDRPRVEMLYGETQLPVYDPAADAWAPAPTGYTPVYGPSGFGNPFNNYTWTMTVAGGRLFVGTMDWSAVAAKTTLPSQPTRPIFNPDPAQFGGELWAFTAPDRPAVAIDTTGLGNYLNYGIRTMATDANNLYLGMANPMNLRTDPNDDVPEGGWELLQLARR